MTSELTSESTSHHARSCVSSRSRANGEGPLILRSLLDLLGGSSPPALLGMTSVRPFDTTPRAASLIARSGGHRPLLQGETSQESLASLASHRRLQVHRTNRTTR